MGEARYDISARDPLTVAVRKIARACTARFLEAAHTPCAGGLARDARRLDTLVRVLGPELGEGRPSPRLARDLAWLDRRLPASPPSSVLGSARGQRLMTRVAALARELEAPPPAPPPTESGARRGGRRIVARALRKVARRGKRIQERSGDEAFRALAVSLRRARHLAAFFAAAAAPEVRSFLERADRLQVLLDEDLELSRELEVSPAAEREPRERALRAQRREFVAELRRFRRREVQRLAVPDL